MTSQFAHDVIVIYFWRYFVSLVKFSYWSKFHVNIITGSGIMTVFFYKGLTRIPEIGNTPAWGLPNIWRLGQDRDTEFGTNVLGLNDFENHISIKMIHEKYPEILPESFKFQLVSKNEVKKEIENLYIKKSSTYGSIPATILK